MGATGTAPARLNEHYEVPVWLQEMPKTDLHCHMGGSIRIPTILELASNYGVDLRRFGVSDADLTEEGLRKHVVYKERLAHSKRPGSRSLNEYLNCFHICESVFVRPEVFSRVAYEVCQDAHSEGVNIFELRFGPTRYMNNGGKLHSHEIMESTIDGITRASKDFHMHTGLIVCGVRDNGTSEEDKVRAIEMVRVAADLATLYQVDDFREYGVVGFDLAGKEKGNRPRDFKPAFENVHDNFVPITVHAGEADSVGAIAEAFNQLNADRIGHATTILQSEKLYKYANRVKKGIEVCITSNVDTGAVASVETHPARKFYRDGLRICINTDNRTISDTTVTKEYLLLLDHLGFTRDDVLAVAQNGIKVAFLQDNERKPLRAHFDAYVKAARDDMYDPM